MYQTMPHTINPNDTSARPNYTAVSECFMYLYCVLSFSGVHWSVPRSRSLRMKKSQDDKYLIHSPRMPPNIGRYPRIKSGWIWQSGRIVLDYNVDTASRQGERLELGLDGNFAPSFHIRGHKHSYFAFNNLISFSTFASTSIYILLQTICNFYLTI